MKAVVSTALEVLGLAAWVVAALLLGGMPAALIVGGLVSLFIGIAVDAPAGSLRRTEPKE